jgi:hypothetical protein
MNDRDRLEQLEGLLARLERMPASAGRDWMLAEVRGRAVDVETGMPNTPLRALPRDESQVEVVEVVTPPAPKAAAPAARPRTQPRRHAARARVAPIVRLPQVRQRVHEEVVDLLGMDGVLDLDDSPAAATGVSRPWSRGLRG